MKGRASELEVHQVNCFYNYTVGIVTTDVNLLKTTSKLLKSGIARTVFFTDLKCVYLDDKGNVQLEWLRPQGRQWDSGWTVKSSTDLPHSVVEELTISLELSFHEQRIEAPEARQMAPHIRAALPHAITHKSGNSGQSRGYGAHLELLPGTPATADQALAAIRSVGCERCG